MIVRIVLTVSFPSCGAPLALTQTLASRSNEPRADSLEISRFLPSFLGKMAVFDKTEFAPRPLMIRMHMYKHIYTCTCMHMFVSCVLCVLQSFHQRQTTKTNEFLLWSICVCKNTFVHLHVYTCMFRANFAIYSDFIGDRQKDNGVFLVLCMYTCIYTCMHVCIYTCMLHAFSAFYSAFIGDRHERPLSFYSNVPQWTLPSSWKVSCW